MSGAVTAEELAQRMAKAGKAITLPALRYHCRDPRGALYGKAYRSSGVWLIPVEAAADFAATYEPYGSLRKRAPVTPPATGALLTESRYTPQGGRDEQ